MSRGDVPLALNGDPGGDPGQRPRPSPQLGASPPSGPAGAVQAGRRPAMAPGQRTRRTAPQAVGAVSKIDAGHSGSAPPGSGSTRGISRLAAPTREARTPVTVPSRSLRARPSQTPA